MTLYFITAVGPSAAWDTGDNLDTFVRADSIDEAKGFWRERHKLEPHIEPDYVYKVPPEKGATGVIDLWSIWTSKP